MSLKFKAIIKVSDSTRTIADKIPQEAVTFRRISPVRLMMPLHTSRDPVENQVTRRGLSANSGEFRDNKI